MNTENQALKEQEMVTKLDALVKEQNSKDHYVIVEDKGMYAALRGGAFDVHVDVQKTHLTEQGKLAILEKLVQECFHTFIDDEVTFSYLTSESILDVVSFTKEEQDYIRQLATDRR